MGVPSIHITSQSSGRATRRSARRLPPTLWPWSKPRKERPRDEGEANMTSSRLVLRTRLCDLLGIDYPILQSGMGLIAGPDLVGAVSGAGALGIVAGFMLAADPLRAAIRDVRAGTKRPFGVNLWLSADLRPSGAAGRPSDEIVEKVQAALNPIRATIGLPPAATSPSLPPDLVSGALEVVLD